MMVTMVVSGREGDNVVVYRRQIIANGNKLDRNEDGPIWALDVAHMTLAYKRKHRAHSATWTDSDRRIPKT